MWRVVILSTLAAVSCAAEQQQAAGTVGECSHAAAALRSMRPAAGTFSPELRVDADTDALHYDLHLDVDPVAEYLTGNNTMTVKSLAPALATFEFRLDDAFTINAVEVNDLPAIWLRLDEETVEVTLNQVYAPDEVFELSVAYEGHPTGSGFGSIVFGEHDGSPTVYTLSEPWFSYTWWPTKDDNTDKATGELRITVPDTMIVAANGLLLGEQDMPDGKREFYWKTDYQTATYLFCFAAAEYNLFSDTWEYGDVSMPMEFFIYPWEDTPENRDKWLMTNPMLTVMSDAFGIYPFADEKYGICHFGFGGGMEHQTITGQGTFSEWVTAHEAGHQWWGDMITCATWHDIWINEGFATYSEAIWAELKHGGSDEQALLDYMAGRRPGRFDGSVYVYDISNVGRIFSGNFSYRKGAWVLHQLRHVVGNDTFFEILAAFRDTYEYDSATTADFQQVAEAVSERDLNWFFQEWVYEIGAPTYQYGWRQLSAGDEEFVELFVRQVQTDDYPIYTMPVDVVVNEGGVEQTHVVWNDAEQEHLLFPVSDVVSGMMFDPQEWILKEGAILVGFVSGPPKITSITPEPDSVMTPSEIDGIEIVFHKDVAVSAADFSLTDSGGTPAGFSFSYDPTNWTATLSLVGELGGETYELTIADSTIDVEMGLSLDGELQHAWGEEALPSGDGLPGGDAVMTFTVLLAGDLDGDGDVDQTDLGILLASYEVDDGGDIDGDGDTDQTDLGLLLANYGLGI